MGKKDKSTETFVSGLVFTAGFGIALGALGLERYWWLLFPLLFLGVAPLAKGAQGLIARWRQNRVDPYEREALTEKEILRLAENEGGKVTPALVALKTHLTAEKAEEVLQRMVKKNYANMNVTTEGRVEYEFPEFRRLE